MLKLPKGKRPPHRRLTYRRNKAGKGFSLVEIMLSSLLISVVMLIAWTGLISALNMSAAAQAKTNLKIELTKGLDVMTNEIRQAQAINRTANTMMDGSGITLNDVVVNAGIDLNHLGNYGDIGLYLELPTDPTITSCASGAPAEDVDRIVYDIRDSPQSWLPPKVIARYGRIPDERGQINPCSQPVSNDIIADSISAKNDSPLTCAGVLSGSNGFQTCTVGDQVSLHLNSSVESVTQKPIETTIAPRTVVIAPTTQDPVPASPFSTILTMRATPPPNEKANLLWTWTVDGTDLSIQEDNDAGYYVQDIDWFVVNPNNHSDIKFQTTLVTQFGIDMKSYSEHNLVGFMHAHPELDNTYSTTCFTAHGVTPEGEKITSNTLCTDHQYTLF
ncbi:MAG: hypothetical protein HC810_03430 [Acaryochloridaceae cyanobacterium RL_2_7]|nr:hypothetical protein [Acaryochloridaceae cyanobacterium RL_2_7]